MKVTVEVDCTPVEARSFLGLPDVTGLKPQNSASVAAAAAASESAILSHGHVRIRVVLIRRVRRLVPGWRAGSV